MAEALQRVGQGGIDIGLGRDIAVKVGGLMTLCHQAAGKCCAAHINHIPQSHRRAVSAQALRACSAYALRRASDDRHTALQFEIDGVRSGGFHGAGGGR